MDIDMAKFKKMKKRTLFFAAAAILLLVMVAVRYAFSQDRGVAVTTVRAQRGDLQESISTSGIVQGEKVKIIFSPASGRVAEVPVALGEAVLAGEELVRFDMEEMERSLRQAALQHDKSSAAYQSALADSADGQSKLASANARLKELESLIADNKARLKELQRTMSDSTRNTGNALARQAQELRDELAKLEEARAKLSAAADSVSSGNGQAGGAGSLSDAQKKELEAINQKIADVNSQISQNTYLQSTYASSDYVEELKRAIEDTQEHITMWEEEKAKMEARKSEGESKSMDAYDRQQSAADRELAEISYEIAKEEYEAAKMGICADFDGIVTECAVTAGAAVTKGMQLCRLESSKDVKVSFQVSKHDVEKLKAGQKAEVVIAGNRYQGEVGKINRMAAVSGSSTTPMVGVEVHLQNPDDAIVLGLDAKLTIDTNQAHGALMIPVEAVNADKNGDFLYIVEGGKAVKRSIVCGISTDTYVEVLEGIAEEDEIVISSATALEEGMAVKALPQASSDADMASQTPLVLQ